MNVWCLPVHKKVDVSLNTIKNEKVSEMQTISVHQKTTKIYNKLKRKPPKKCATISIYLCNYKKCIITSLQHQKRFVEAFFSV